MARLRCSPSRLRSAQPRLRSPQKERAEHYGTPAHEAWALAVKERDGWRCVDPAHDPRRPRYGAGVTLYADHVRELRDAPELALDVANGMTRCAHCHGRKTADARRMRFR